jgi:hypothetical protein
MAVARRNWKASWTSGDWVSRREAKGWSSGRKIGGCVFHGWDWDFEYGAKRVFVV